jgi:arylsulfatase
MMLRLVLALLLSPLLFARAAPDRPPNVVLVFCDDLGYGDLGCFGAKDIATPHLDRLAADGLKLTSFYVAQAVCSASRAALLTGSFPNRIGIFGALGPRSKTGLHPEEVTLAEVFKSRGYATGMAGKWHLGDAPAFNPLRHGFDEYLGIPYSNDMWPVWYDGTPAAERQPKRNYPVLPLLEGERTLELVHTLEDQARFTGRFAERGADFIRRNKDRPFFFYLAHPMPHVPLAASPAFRGKSKGGFYGDVIEEIDASVGTVLRALEETGTAENTLVIFTSDNGPWLRFGNHAGSAGPLREGKGTMFEGGCRVPFVARWPGKIAPGRVSDAIVATVDLLPTLATLIGAPLPDRRLDGVDQSRFLLDPQAASARDHYLYFYGDQLQAYRQGPWKLLFPHKVSQYAEGSPRGKDGFPAGAVSKAVPLALYNLAEEIGERTDRSAEFPERVKALTDLARAAEAELKANRRPAGKLP